MKIVVAYVRAHQAAHVVHTLYGTGVQGFTAYVVHGMSGETSTFLRGLQPFEPANLPETVKIEVICEDGVADTVMATIARAARTGYPGDGIVAVQAVENLVRIQDVG